jgi:hypothetical protein
MKKITIFVFILFISAIFTAPAHSDGIKKVAQTGLQFLKVDVGARAAAMGGAFLVGGYDASIMFYNPAGIANISSDLDLFAGQTQWIADINYNTAAVVKNFGTLGTFGISIVLADYGDDIIGTQVATNDKGYVETGNLDVGAYAIGISYAKQLTDKFTVGAHVRYTGQKLGENLMADGSTMENKVDGLSFDFGTIFYPGFKSFRFGMSVRNFSADYQYEEESFELPLTFTIGVAMNVLDFMESQSENHSLVVAIDAIHPRDYTERIHLGTEYWFNNMFALRGGYKFNYDEEGLTAGLGVKLNVSNMNFKLDYAYTDFGVFDSVNRFSVGFSF